MKNGVNFVLLEKEPFIREVQFYDIKVANVFTQTAMKMLRTSHPNKVNYFFCIFISKV